MKPSGIISLLTDFGTQDGYTGAMRGVILSIHPQAIIVDISHDIPPQDIEAAGFLLEAHSKYFPRGTVHVAVVDPGVGTERRIILAKTADYYYLAPDNGLLTFLLGHPHVRFYQAANPDYWLPEVSTTFHGRDIFSPLAAHLARGEKLEKMFSPVQNIVTLEKPDAKKEGCSIIGRVIYVDRFGNMITNIKREWLPEQLERTEVIVQGQAIGPVMPNYASAARGQLVATMGSFNRVEIAVNLGSALEYFNHALPEEIVVKWC